MRNVPIDRLPVIDGDITTIKLTQGQTAIIDAEDAVKVSGHTWCAQWCPNIRGFYAVTMVPVAGGGYKTIGMHRLIMGDPPGKLVDHKNHQTLDNRRINLRVCSRTENQRNRRTQRNNTSGYLGVSLENGRGWQAQVMVNGHGKSIGYFASAASAAHARDDFIRQNHPSEYWTMNFPLPGERGVMVPAASVAA